MDTRRLTGKPAQTGARSASVLAATPLPRGAARHAKQALGNVVSGQLERRAA